VASEPATQHHHERDPVERGGVADHACDPDGVDDAGVVGDGVVGDGWAGAVNSNRVYAIRNPYRSEVIRTESAAATANNDNNGHWV